MQKIFLEISQSSPLDIIGDVHGCYDELIELLKKLGYSLTEKKIYEHSEDRKIVFVGDLTDKGPKSVQVLDLVMTMFNHGRALCIKGNHEDKLLRKLKGRDVKLTHGLNLTIDELNKKSLTFRKELTAFLEKLPNYIIFFQELVVAHAGILEHMIGVSSPKVNAFTLYGSVTNKFDDKGLPVRLDWAQEYRGDKKVIYGHTPIKDAIWINKTLNIDLGCVSGGYLCALQYPSLNLVKEKAKSVYYKI